MSEITIATWQAAGHLDDVDANIAALRRASTAARAQGADLLITPEMYLSGYNIPAAALQAQEQVNFTGLVADIARENRLSIVAGIPEFTTAGIFNTSVLVSAEGTVLMQHRKYQLFGDLDRSLFIPGDMPVTSVSHLGLILGTMICYDVEFPESVREARRQGVELLVVPTAQMEGFATVNDAVIRTRAWDNGLYLAYVNRVGSEGELTYIGQSSVCSPSGQRLTGLAPVDTEELAVVTIDTQAVAEARRTNPYLDDLRPYQEQMHT